MDLLTLKKKFAFSGKARAKFYLAMASKMENGNDRIKHLESQRNRAIQRMGPKSGRALLLEEFTQGLKSGTKMDQVFEPYISPAETMLLSAGEQSGSQVLVLRLAAKLTGVRKGIRGAVLSNSAQPIGLLAMMYALLIFIGAYEVPQLSVLSKPSTWTGGAHTLYLLSAFATSYMAWVFPVILATVIGFIIWRMPYWTGPGRIFLDNYIPPWSVNKVVEGGIWLMSFAALVRSGIGRQDAIAFQAQRSKPWLRQRLEASLALMRDGGNIGRAFHEAGFNFPSRDIIDDLEDYSESDRFDEILQNIAVEWVDSSVKRVETLMSVVKLVVTILFVGAFAWLMLNIVALSMSVGTSVTHGLG